MKIQVNIASVLCGWMYLLLTTLRSSRGLKGLVFEQPLIYLGLGTSLFFWLLSVGFALRDASPPRPRLKPHDVFFAVLLGLPLCFWLYFYARDMVFG